MVISRPSVRDLREGQHMKTLSILTLATLAVIALAVPLAVSAAPSASTAATCMTESQIQRISNRKNISCAAARRAAMKVYAAAADSGTRVPECTNQRSTSVAGWRLRGRGSAKQHTPIATKMSKGNRSFVIGGGGAC